MEINITDNVLTIIYKDEIEKLKLLDWYMTNIRQYRHNDNSGMILGLDLECIKIKEK